MAAVSLSGQGDGGLDRPVVLKTRLTREYQLEIPFVNAGMAFVATAPLATAVCNAGGLGMIGVAAMSPEVVRAQIGEVRRATHRPFGVNIIARFSTPEQIEVLVEERVPVVVFFWDEAPVEWIRRLRAAGSKIWFQIGSVAEARAAMAQEAEALIVQGAEAGGHNRSSAGLLSLLPAVCDVAGDRLILASGGIADGRTAAAALALGADGGGRDRAQQHLWPGVPGRNDAWPAQPPGAGMGGQGRTGAI
jgi:enoyl-[acyl-carrier protein] reductase II